MAEYLASLAPPAAAATAPAVLATAPVQVPAAKGFRMLRVRAVIGLRSLGF